MLNWRSGRGYCALSISAGLLAWGCGGQSLSTEREATSAGAGGAGGSPSSLGEDSSASAAGYAGTATLFALADADLDGELTPNDIVESGMATRITDAQWDAIVESACAGWSIEIELLPQAQFFLVDASATMGESFGDGSDRTKFEFSVETISEVLQAEAAAIFLGGWGFPHGDVTEICVDESALIPFDFLGTSQASFLSALGATQTGSCRATLDAYTRATQYVASAQPYAENTIVLLTDGSPTLGLDCNGALDQCAEPSTEDSTFEEELIALIATAREQLSIKTVIVGLPGTEESALTGADTRGWLSEAAEAGDTVSTLCSHDGEPYCHVDWTASNSPAEDLLQAIPLATGIAMSCEYSIPTPPAGETMNEDDIALVYDAGADGRLLIHEASSSSCVHGWYRSSDLLHFCAGTCAALASGKVENVSWLFGCNSPDIGP